MYVNVVMQKWNYDKSTHVTALLLDHINQMMHMSLRCEQLLRGNELISFVFHETSNDATFSWCIPAILFVGQ